MMTCPMIDGMVSHLLELKLFARLEIRSETRITTTSMLYNRNEYKQVR
jgi:hypothetical protein